MAIAFFIALLKYLLNLRCITLSPISCKLKRPVYVGFLLVVINLAISLLFFSLTYKPGGLVLLRGVPMKAVPAAILVLSFFSVALVILPLPSHLVCLVGMK